MTDRRQRLAFAGTLVLLFLLVGIGLGIVGNRTVAYVIEVVGAQDNPSGSPFVANTLFAGILLYVGTGISLSAVFGSVTGFFFADEPRVGSAISGGSALVGVALLAFVALILTGIAISGGGGGGEESSAPDPPTMAIGIAAVLSAVIAAVTSYVGSAISR